MNWKVITTEEQYQIAIKRTLLIFDSELRTDLGDELALLLLIVKDYEAKNISLPSLDPLEVIKFRREGNGI
ncbi:MAG: transcriptional regulator [Saprospiraceae bacterium]|nr:transcriptional regulator [Candidatus Brachybacter algidus]